MGGLGSVPLTALAKALASGSLHPKYDRTQTWQPAYTDTPERITGDFFLDDTTAQQVASLLGGSLYKGRIQNWQGQVPDGWWIALPDGGTMLAAWGVWPLGSDAQAPESTVSFGARPDCAYQFYLAQNVPGGQVDSDCAAYLKSMGYNVTNYDDVAVQYVPPEAPAGTKITGLFDAADVYAINAQNASKVTPTNPATGVPTGFSTADQLAQVQPVARAGSPVTAPTVNGTTLAPSANPQPGAAASPITTPGLPFQLPAVLSESSFGGVPNWALALGAAAVLFFFMPGGKR